MKPANSTPSRSISRLRACRPYPSHGRSRFGGYLYVVVDKFTKWAEVEAVRTIPAGSAVKFIKGLMSRSGVPDRIITDNSS